jgi:fucokinase
MKILPHESDRAAEIVTTSTCDYLIVTASNDAQASSYLRQLRLRSELGLLSGFRHSLVVTDPGGRRAGNGGSTLCCLMEVLGRELADRGTSLPDAEAWTDALRKLRILIIHAGGDSRRLPAYGPSGRLFLPLPGIADSAVGSTLFDRQLPTYRALLCPEQVDPAGLGQIVIAAGDVLLRFDPQEVQWNGEGVCGLGCLVSPGDAARHGVFCLDGSGPVRRFLQKPSVEVQAQERAITAYGQSVLDVGVFHFDAETAIRLLRLAEVQGDDSGRLHWSGPIGRSIEEHGLDFYREIACAFGTDTTLESHGAAARTGGSRWGEAELRRIYDVLHDVPCRVQVIKQCEFLHFGTSRQIIESGQQLVRSEAGFASSPPAAVCSNSSLESAAAIAGGPCWIEGCAIGGRLTLAGENVLVGIDIQQPLELPRQACLDVLPGTSRAGRPVVFIRCYGIDDLAGCSKLCGESLDWWAAKSVASDSPRPSGDCSFGLWDASLPSADRSLWNARIFPAERDAAGFRHWLWLFHPKAATVQQWEVWRAADRYSFEEMAARADGEAFDQRRRRLHFEVLKTSLSRYFCHDSSLSAADLAQAIECSGAPEIWIAAVLREARRREESCRQELQAKDPVTEAFSFARVIHSLGSALTRRTDNRQNNRDRPEVAHQVAGAQNDWLRGARAQLDAEMLAWLDRHGLSLAEDTTVEDWASRAQGLAFDDLRRRIVTSGRPESCAVRCALRSDEIAWGRAPARLDLAGGWSDTPPYTLENGGTVLNAAVLLNGQPPVQVYGRVTGEPLIRVRSIDLGTHLDISTWDGLLDYNSAVGAFSLVKAALVICGFTPHRGAECNRSLSELLADFGGGLEITTLAAIPKGSGLGTSSIMGAVLLAVINRMLGRTLPHHELFHKVLQLEQELTTGGGWQDQIGGAIGGLKIAATRAGLLPQATIRYVPADTLDPRLNGGLTLLYYTGVTRLAKNILQNVVGRYLDRDRQSMEALGQLGGLAERMAEAMGRKDIQQFGQMIDHAWSLNLQLDPHSTTAEIEDLLARLRPHLHGAKLLGAGGGGFLLLVAKSTADAHRITTLLEGAPPNDRARFFEFQVSDAGLEVSVC